MPLEYDVAETSAESTAIAVEGKQQVGLLLGLRSASFELGGGASLVCARARAPGGGGARRRRR